MSPDGGGALAPQPRVLLAPWQRWAWQWWPLAPWVAWASSSPKMAVVAGGSDASSNRGSRQAREREIHTQLRQARGCPPSSTPVVGFHSVARGPGEQCCPGGGRGLPFYRVWALPRWRKRASSPPHVVGLRHGMRCSASSVMDEQGHTHVSLPFFYRKIKEEIHLEYTYTYPIPSISVNHPSLDVWP
jgi:hypothetical protein